MASQQDSGFFEISIKYLLKSWSNRNSGKFLIFGSEDTENISRTDGNL